MPTINISEGVTPTERLLADLCERTFLLLWSYPNPYKDDGKELCDLIVVFEDRVFLFFDRESRRFDNNAASVELNWNRWKREVIEKQINTSNGAERYIKSGRPIYLDGKKSQRLPMNIRPDSKISKFIVAHGAKEACKNFSPENIYGSLAICYDTNIDRSQISFPPFVVNLSADRIVHVLDSENLEILLQSLDTITDFSNYITEKEQTIEKLAGLYYCGEEDLLAHYLSNFDTSLKRYRISVTEDNPDILMISEGNWSDFVSSDRFRRWKEANEHSYVWDKLIQKTCANAIGGTLGGSNILFGGSSAIHEMAKEPRVSRRSLSERILKSIEEFHISQDYKESSDGIMRRSSLMSSFYPDKAYIFLQIYQENRGNYESDYRPMRQNMLEVSCGAAKIKMPQLKKVVGIATDPPKVSDVVSEDFILMNCEEWTAEDEARYREANDVLRFWETASLKQFSLRTYEFPD